MEVWRMAASSLAVLLSLILAFKSTTVPVRDNLDKFIDDLNRQGWWARLAAGVAIVGWALEKFYGS